MMTHTRLNNANCYLVEIIICFCYLHLQIFLSLSKSLLSDNEKLVYSQKSFFLSADLEVQLMQLYTTRLSYTRILVHSMECKSVTCVPYKAK